MNVLQGSGFCFRITSKPDGFIVSATTDRTPPDPPPTLAALATTGRNMKMTITAAPEPASRAEASTRRRQP